MRIATLLIAAVAALQNPSVVRQYQDAVTPAKLAAHVRFLASDLLEGRETGTRGQKIATEYLVAQYEALGLRTQVQPFDVHRVTPKSWRLEVDGEDVSSEAYFVRGNLANASGKWELIEGKTGYVAEIVREKRRLDGVLEVRKQFAAEAAKATAAARRIGDVRLESASPLPPMFGISEALAARIRASSNPVIRATIVPDAPIATENVFAFLEGSDLKDEYVVISSHYDHIGMDPALTGDRIYNGAADDASGTAATLAIAEAFVAAKRAGHGPRRSLLFINFSAEEKGVIGSRFYVNHPVVPLGDVAAVLHMDGVAGYDPKHARQSRNAVYVMGELSALNARVREAVGIDLELDEGRGKPFSSDHLTFEAQLVPYIYYATGLTEHHHALGDEASTLDYEQMTRIVRLVFATAWQTANRDERPPHVDRSKLRIAGYTCPPCGGACDELVFEQEGTCPVCSMGLAPRLVAIE